MWSLPKLQKTVINLCPKRFKVPVPGLCMAADLNAVAEVSFFERVLTFTSSNQELESCVATEKVYYCGFSFKCCLKYYHHRFCYNKQLPSKAPVIAFICSESFQFLCLKFLLSLQTRRKYCHFSHKPHSSNYKHQIGISRSRGPITCLLLYVYSALLNLR